VRSRACAGTSFGLAGVVTVGGVNCPIVSQADTRIVCTVPAGEGQGLLVQAFVSSTASNTWPFSYGLPTVLAVAPSNGPTAGGSTVLAHRPARARANRPACACRAAQIVVNGTNFGLTGSVVIGSRPCASVSRSHTRISCTLPEGAGLNQSVAVSVLSALSNSLLFNYDPPTISSIVPATADSGGGTTLTINGAPEAARLARAALARPQCKRNRRTELGPLGHRDNQRHPVPADVVGLCAEQHALHRAARRGPQLGATLSEPLRAELTVPRAERGGDGGWPVGVVLRVQLLGPRHHRRDARERPHRRSHSYHAARNELRCALAEIRAARSDGLTQASIRAC
jgi:hypothetical protein